MSYFLGEKWYFGKKILAKKMVFCIEMPYFMEKSHILGEAKSYFGEKSAI